MIEIIKSVIESTVLNGLLVEEKIDEWVNCKFILNSVNNFSSIMEIKFTKSIESNNPLLENKTRLSESKRTPFELSISTAVLKTINFILSFMHFPHVNNITFKIL
jgi:ribosomal protein L28